MSGPLGGLALVLLMALAVLTPPAATAAIHKCTINGAVSYQNTPCPSADAGPRPTVQQLNAERQQRLREAAEKSAVGAASAPSTAAPTGFRCDGRTRCPQMRSCAEAKFFLAHCPGTEMDGNHDGIPCERQWCGH